MCSSTCRQMTRDGSSVKYRLEKTSRIRRRPFSSFGVQLGSIPIAVRLGMPSHRISRNGEYALHNTDDFVTQRSQGVCE
jgi:hypothetical protein